MEHYTMNLTLKVWRQKNGKDKGGFETYQVPGISSEMSFLEMFDVLNERLVAEGKESIAFDHDCREGICGMCSMHINGKPVDGTASWKRKELAIKLRMPSPTADITLHDYWSLSPDGNTLTMEHRDGALAGQITILEKSK